jgi:hypothetical protein
VSKKKGQRVSTYQSRRRRKRHSKNQDRLEHRNCLHEYSYWSLWQGQDHKINFNKHDAGQEASHNKVAQKCSTAKSVEEFVDRLNKIGDKLNTHHIYPQSRIGASWDIVSNGFITQEWNELRVLERKHVCLNILFELVIKIKGVTVTISRTPQEICKQIELWGDASGKIDLGQLNAIQIVAWSELFGRIDNVKEAIDLIKKEWDIQKWQSICKELSMLRVRKSGPYWFVRNHELKLAVATVSARYRKIKESGSDKYK